MINKDHQIYIDIFSDMDQTFEKNKTIIEEVETFIAYSITGENEYLTNLLLNL